jgi:Spy/CpxP family protein refolding chaperone
MNALTVKIAASLVVLFGLGAATGVVAASKLSPRLASAPARMPVEERWSNARFQEYRTRLNLTPAQVAAIAPHFRQFGEDMRLLRADLRERFTASLRNLNENIARDLTPEQRQELWRLAKQRWQQGDAGTPRR